MGFQYKQISIEERCEIARCRRIRSGKSLQIWIAASVARELKRNESRCHALLCPSADPGPSLVWVTPGDKRPSRLTQGWSPQQVAGRLAREAGHNIIPTNPLPIHLRTDRSQEELLLAILPKAKSKRGYRKPKASSPASFIRLRRPLTERPQRTPGHWEADLMLFSTYGQAVHPGERHSRLLLAPGWKLALSLLRANFRQRHGPTSPTPSASRPSSAIPAAEGWHRERPVACAGPCLARPTPVGRVYSVGATTIPRANASATILPLRLSGTGTSNVNAFPPSETFELLEVGHP